MEYQPGGRASKCRGHRARGIYGLQSISSDLKSLWLTTERKQGFRMASAQAWQGRTTHRPFTLRPVNKSECVCVCVLGVFFFLQHTPIHSVRHDGGIETHRNAKHTHPSNSGYNSCCTIFHRFHRPLLAWGPSSPVVIGRHDLLHTESISLAAGFLNIKFDSLLILVRYPLITTGVFQILKSHCLFFLNRRSGARGDGDAPAPRRLLRPVAPLPGGAGWRLHREEQAGDVDLPLHACHSDLLQM